MNSSFVSEWNFYPSVLIGFGLWTAAYVVATNRMGIRRRRDSLAVWHQISFHLGTLIGLCALISPLDSIGDEYLFSAHMLQHLLLMFLVPPLWLMGVPGWLIDHLIPISLKKTARWLTRPLPAFLIFSAVMCIWHIPFLYDFAQEHEAVHIVEHLTFIGASIIGWWPVAVSQNESAPLPAAPLRMLYLFLLGIPMTALSALLTFSSKPLYSAYINAPRLFDLSVMDDQRLGALLMWVPAHMVLFVALCITFQKWSVDEERQADALYSNLLS